MPKIETRRLPEFTYWLDSTTSSNLSMMIGCAVQGTYEIDVQGGPRKKHFLTFGDIAIFKFLVNFFLFRLESGIFLVGGTLEICGVTNMSRSGSTPLISIIAFLYRLNSQHGVIVRSQVSQWSKMLSLFKDNNYLSKKEGKDWIHYMNLVVSTTTTRIYSKTFRR